MYRDSAGLLLHESADHLEQGALARTVGTEERDDRAARDRHADFAQGNYVAVRRADVSDVTSHDTHLDVAAEARGARDVTVLYRGGCALEDQLAEVEDANHDSHDSMPEGGRGPTSRLGITSLPRLLSSSGYFARPVSAVLAGARMEWRDELGAVSSIELCDKV